MFVGQAVMWSGCVVSILSRIYGDPASPVFALELTLTYLGLLQSYFGCISEIAARTRYRWHLLGMLLTALVAYSSITTIDDHVSMPFAIAIVFTVAGCLQFTLTLLANALRARWNVRAQRSVDSTTHI